ncbi:MAG TPA: MFS transporter [Hyphomicrobium sp.]|uniref:MFS transporter n=1 Tax=Hyphomicrobium sp. TaxID=82 RepID=UPI002B9B5EE0|nr:MFS transporter [Hyphomicrobium sp.]HXE02307.1 MFS transporter [Hyphomicrobium sp.]
MSERGSDSLELVFTSRQRGLSLAAVIAASFGVGLSFGIGFPLTALTFEAWQQPNWMIGLAGAIPAIAVLIALPILPRLVARLGAVAAIAGGCLAGAVGFLALYAFPLPWAWIGIRLLMSAGFALPWLAGETWINTVAREETRGRVIAIYAIAFFSGFSAGPIILQTLGLSGFWPFLVGAAGTAIAGVPILLARRLAPEFCHDGSRSFASAMGLAPVAMAGAFIGGFAEISNLSLIPNVALAAGLSPDSALWLLSTMTAGGVALQFPIGWLSDKVSRFTVTIALAIVFIVLALALPMALTTPLAAIVVAFLIGGVILGFYTVGLAIIGEHVGANDLAAANAAFLVMYQAGAIVGPFVAGIAMTTSPVTGFVATVVTLMAVSGFVLLVLERNGRRRAQV